MTDVALSQSDSPGRRTRSTVRIGGRDDGGTVSYAEYGTPGGTPVVFLHGTPGSHILGELLDDVARTRDVRLIAVDRPGYGRSDPWPSRTLVDTAGFLAPILDETDVAEARVVGFSGGGPHALAFAATRPDLVSGVDLVAGATPPSLTDSVPRTQRLLRTLARSTPLLLRGLTRGQAWLAERTSPATVVSQYTTEDGHRQVSDATADVVKRDFVAAFARHRRGFVTESRLLGEEWPFALADIDHPVRLWHGEDDSNVPVAAARRLATELPDGRLTVFEETDHLNALTRWRDEEFGKQVPMTE